MERKTLKVLSGVEIFATTFSRTQSGRKILQSEVIGRVGDVEEMSTLPKTDP